MSIAQSLLEIVVEEGCRHRLVQVKVIRLQVGALAAVVPESLTFCFGLLTQGTVASGAALEIETLPIVARCAACDTLFEVENQSFLCPQCGEPTIDLVSGRELSVMSIEGETGDENDRDQDSRGPEHIASQ